jgi:hypothetical protein
MVLIIDLFVVIQLVETFVATFNVERQAYYVVCGKRKRWMLIVPKLMEENVESEFYE